MNLQLNVKVDSNSKEDVIFDFLLYFFLCRTLEAKRQIRFSLISMYFNRSDYKLKRQAYRSFIKKLTRDRHYFNSLIK